MTGDRILLWLFVGWTALFGIWPWFGHPSHDWSDDFGAKADLIAHGAASAALGVAWIRSHRRRGGAS
jgi:hypothetical protein